jgi:hypothetical protein
MKCGWIIGSESRVIIHQSVLVSVGKVDHARTLTSFRGTVYENHEKRKCRSAED